MSYRNPFEDEQELEPSRNYFVRHWRGENTLPFAYWVNGSILNIALAFAVRMIQEQVANSSISLRLMAFSGLTLILLSLAAWVWSSVGIWRSATRHPYRGGSGGWATVAKGMMVVGCLVMVVRAPSLFLATHELGQLAAGHDSIGSSASITVRGDGALQVTGFLTQGFADRFATALKANPGARLLVLQSPGGRIVESERMAQMVKGAGLDTLADGECSSACIFPFLAGKRRLVGAEARLGFHQPTFPGISEAERRDGIVDFRDAMIKAGVKRAFAYQAVTAAPDDMWYPDLPTLVDAQVVTGLDRSMVVADQRISAAALGKQIPKQIDPYTVLASARADGVVLEYTYQISVPAARLDVSGLKAGIVAQVCTDPGMAMVVRSGGVYRAVYRNARGAVVASVEVAHC
ncbi:MAG: hypothetical protein EOP59_00660 [Sphingomonadales bacterium]|nr:MAG: hypothetical protein EOP59_00660 [Sphingomonadales bacterium]